ncbi:secretion protein HlyD [Tolypothrix tenuis PCC 7101]|uniref:Secretion protein HlyD n=1 Tax=Tolypothrix tenuis PCC 7101 TaxID=231146 RepID=A0A1Z4MWK8_9CYAN|nr:response regulator [Aulosira sp. FACHB-113]BAY97858.1 secretion protein HlyD [Tolypothrix tenuis PCC 7101]BAZ71635.1 secretion protein HlyD [Aulosira laxa NIES-50]
MIRVLLVDDQETIREYLRSLIEKETDLEVVGVAENGKAAILKVANLHPDVVLIDMEMPEMDGINATKIISERFPKTKILVLSGYDKHQYINASLNAGACGYILKDASPEELRDSIRLVEKGYTQLAPGLINKIIPQQQLSSSEIFDFQKSAALPKPGTLLQEDTPLLLDVIQTDAVLPHTTRWVEVGGKLLIGSVATAVILSAVIQYQVTVKAPANVRPVGEISLVQSASEGTVRRILVSENQVVNKGDIIATIDDSEILIKKSQVLANIQQNEMQLMQLDAQIRAVDRQISAETERNKKAIAGATAELQHTEREYQQTQVSSSGQLDEVKANIKIAQNELQKAEFDLKSMQANVKATEAAWKAAKLKRDYYLGLAKSGSISQNQLEQVQLTLEQQEQTLLSQKAALEAQKQVIERQKQGVAAATSKYKPAVAATNPNNAVLTVVEAKIAQERSAGDGSLASLQQEKNALLQLRIEIKNIIDNGQKELKQIDKQQQATIIRSPDKGTILKLELRNPQQLVSAGEVIAQVAPSEAPLVVKANVSVEDIGNVKVCKVQPVTACQEGKVQMRISAYPYPDYGILAGAVRSISADAITPQNNAMATTAPYYEVTIEPEKLYLTKGDRSYPIQPGMEVKAEIIAQKESFLTFMSRKVRLLTNL